MRHENYKNGLFIVKIRYAHLENPYIIHEISVLYVCVFQFSYASSLK
jgi:hypothetical protein